MNFAGRLLPPERDQAQTALVTQEAEHTYGQLAAAVGAVARHLLDRGARPGEHVGIRGESSFFWAAAHLGAIHAGCVSVPLSPALSAAECQDIVATTGLRFAFADARGIAGCAGWLAGARSLVLDRSAPLAPAGASVTTFAELPPGSPPSVSRQPDDLAALLFSSGSTGKPRGVMLSHRNLIANTAAIGAALGITAADRVMAVLPFHYTFGASILHTHLAAGACVVIDRRFLFPDKVLARMIETRCTGFAGVPSHYQILLRRSQLKTMRLPDLRWLQQAGGKLAEPFVRELRAALPQAKLFLMYGATEATARITVLAPEEVDGRPWSVGKPIAGVTVRLLNEEGAEVPAGEPGELVVEGESVALGYFQDPAESAATFREGRLHTGDIAIRDEAGYLRIVDRTKSFLKCGGTRVSAQSIEEQLLAFPDLVEAAVIGIPDELLGEAVAAFVVPRDAADATLADRLRAFALAKLPPPLQPKRIEVLQSLPKSAAGKVQRRLLRERL